MHITRNAKKLVVGLALASAISASACVGLGVGPRAASNPPVPVVQQAQTSSAQPIPMADHQMGNGQMDNAQMGNGQMGGHVMAPPTAQGLAHQARDPSVPPIPDGTIKKITFNVTDQKIKVAPDKSLSAWTFDGTVPGPVIHVKQGDTIQFTLNNQSKMAHAIDFHAARTAPNVNYKNVNPGESYTFTWKAQDPGVFMYHCGSAPILQHLAEGMYGAVIVDPANQPLPKVDHEFVFVQSEFYLGETNPDNGITPIDYQKALAGNADVVAFNGYANQYSDHPITVKAGDKIRVYLVNAGPDHFSALHVVGTIFDHVYVDGNPKNDLQGIQTYTVAPGEGSVFDFTLVDPGTYPMVSHSFADATKGAVAVFKAEPS